jgi:hypothetical protein
MLRLLRSFFPKRTHTQKETIILPPSYDEISIHLPPVYTAVDTKKPPSYKEVSHTKTNDLYETIINNIRNNKYNLGAYIFNKSKKLSSFIDYIINHNYDEIIVYIIKCNIDHFNTASIYINKQELQITSTTTILVTTKSTKIKINNRMINECKGFTNDAVLILTNIDHKYYIATNYKSAFSNGNKLIISSME